jgi:hypothetical protein
VHYLKFFLLRVGMFAFIYALAALVIDPRREGSLHLIPASSLVDDRTSKTNLFEKFKSDGPVDGLVLGSSRTLNISPRVLGQLTGLRYFNFAVSAASISDIAKIYEDVLRNGSHPKSIVLGLDVNALLGRRKVEERQIAIAKGAAVARVTQLGTDLLKVFNVDFAHDMVLSVAFAAGLLKPKVINVFDVDGTSLPHRTGFQSEEEYRSSVSTCAATSHAQFERYDMVSDLRFAELKAILKRASSDGARVDIFITPLNPMAEQQITEGTVYNMLRREVTLRLSRESGQVHLTIHDVDASFLQTGVAGWGDCVHYTDRNGNAIVRAITSSGRN